LNDGWGFSPVFADDMIAPEFQGKLEPVRLPHSVAVTPFNSFDTARYEKLSLYRKEFVTEPAWSGKRVLVTFEGAAHRSEVFLNGQLLASHDCGYTAFTVDLTEHLAGMMHKNVLAVKLDSRESLDQPPFGFVIDYMTYGGIYRDVYLEVKNPVYLQDIFVKTRGNHFESEIVLNTADIPEGCTVHQTVVRAGGDGEASAEIEAGVPGAKILTAADASPVEQWSLEKPVLYNAVTELRSADGTVLDTKTVRFGFRDIRFDESGFYLNGTKIKIRGLNRHQSWPYVGYAMPRNMQRDDADILKYELGLNEVRTSHYPQSQYFVDRCDEIGLLVFTEIPGWQHIGGAEWKDKAVQNVRDMVMQYRNHPSVFLWGVRINESPDDDEFYERTNAAARELDPTRPTGGVRCIKKSRLLEDVYTYNDFSHYGPNYGLAHKKDVTDTHGGYMVTEYNGHMFPTKSFDSESHRTEHAVRHANVLEAAAALPELSGASGWCAFDYNTHRDFGSGDKICYHGVMDMFRNPKLAAAVYRSQGAPEVVGDVLEVSSGMDIGEYPAGAVGDVWLFTNADTVRFSVNGIPIKEFSPKDSPYAHLAHPPILVDDYIGHRLVDEDGISEGKSEAVKRLLMAIRTYGTNLKLLPAKYKCSAFLLMLQRVADEKELTRLYGKYIGNWGGSAITYKFEAVRDGKVVKTVIRTPCTEAKLQAVTTRTELVEEGSYDVASVQLRAVDASGNVQPYCQEAVTFRTKGAIELVGPDAVSLKGGMAGAYVRSTGKGGAGTLIVRDWTGAEMELSFTVRV